ncbi:unnamed protein product, partial [Bubo scandiacus]
QKNITYEGSLSTELKFSHFSLNKQVIWFGNVLLLCLCCYFILGTTDVRRVIAYLLFAAFLSLPNSLLKQIFS